MIRRLLTLALLAAGCGVYDPPPELLRSNIERGQFDMNDNPIEVELTEPVREGTLRVRILEGRYATEGDVCLKGAAGRLPGGCDAEAAVFIGDDDPAIAVEEDLGRIRIEVKDRLRYFDRYVLLVDAGLADEKGHRRGIPLELRFQVLGGFEPGPTDFQPGMFFGRLEVEEPMGTKVHFFFWMAVDELTGEMRALGADADPARDFLESTSKDVTPDQWLALPEPPDGFPLIAQGQIADTDQGRVVVFFPFDLVTTKPPVIIHGGEFQGKLHLGSVAGGMLAATKGPAGEREIVVGELSAPEVFIGEGDAPNPLGQGHGPFAFYRLTEEEQPPLADILPAGVTVEEALGHFSDE